jgi:hypothetical protein
MTTNTILRDAALALARKGLRVFPCRVREKKPLVNDWGKRATTDPNVIRGWWHTSSYNIGVVTGQDSGVWILDVDGEQGKQTLLKLEAEHGMLPPTAEVITGKGMHYYWRMPEGIEIRNSQVRGDIPGLDVRGEGGYVLAPPSVHPSGHVYAWTDEEPVPPPVDAPDWLIEVVTKRGHATPVGASPESWRSFLSGRFEGSHRGAAIARLIGLLLRRYLDIGVATDLVTMFNETRCTPPLDADEVADIVNTIWDYEEQRRAAGVDA